MANRSTSQPRARGHDPARQRTGRWSGASFGLTVALLQFMPPANLPHAAAADGPASSAIAPVDVEINRKGLGKEVIVRQGSHEWYMLVEVTPDNTVIVRQHKKGDTYLLDESETHDRAFLPQEVDSAVEAFTDSAKTQASGYKK